MGITLLMDDFGTGYSSLGYLTYLPVDVIKLDKSIVDTYLVPGKDHFIQNVIRLVHDLDKRIIIESVETQGQARRLKELGADIYRATIIASPYRRRTRLTLCRCDHPGRRQRHAAVSAVRIEVRSRHSLRAYTHGSESSGSRAYRLAVR